MLAEPAFWGPCDQVLAGGLPAQEAAEQSVHLTKNNSRQPLWLEHGMDTQSSKKRCCRGATGQTRGVRHPSLQLSRWMPRHSQEPSPMGSPEARVSGWGKERKNRPKTPSKMVNQQALVVSKSVRGSSQKMEYSPARGPCTKVGQKKGAHFMRTPKVLVQYIWDLTPLKRPLPRLRPRLPSTPLTQNVDFLL